MSSASTVNKNIVNNVCILMTMIVLASYIGQRLWINFSISRANFLTNFCSHLDVTCWVVLATFGPILLKWMLIIVIYLVNYSSSLKCFEQI